MRKARGEHFGSLGECCLGVVLFSWIIMRAFVRNGKIHFIIMLVKNLGKAV
jgi:hypothetical protein